MTDAIAKDSRIYVAGHKGLVGSAMVRALQTAGYRNLILHSHKELELTDQSAVAHFFAEQRPDQVVLAAAKVGGIHANDSYPAEFIHGNLAVQTNVIHQAWQHGVKRLLFMGSSCIYPRECPQPIKEEYLLTGPLEPTNQPYALAKIAGIEMCAAYNRQYGTHFVCAMPTNLYGIGDNFDLQSSHVLPALIHKAHLAKMQNQPTLTAWGSGAPRREFLFSDDLAAACLLLLQRPWERISAVFPTPRQPLVNIGCGQDSTIRELVELVAKVVGYRGKIVWDSSKPDGTPRKLLDISRIQSLGWQPNTSLEAGIDIAYRDFLARQTTGAESPAIKTAAL
ncbi:MAG: GDP-L-fucose synthase [Betaproteobacteria bacterium]|nr:GDP-L-fucose synthase [Betaproteobacteria bacterium]